jgi:hypothetical protein
VECGPIYDQLCRKFRRHENGRSHLLSLIYRDAVSAGIYQIDQFHKVMLDGFLRHRLICTL